jgi:hypothetical protein
MLASRTAARLNQRLAAATWRVAVLSAATEISPHTIAVQTASDGFRSMLMSAAGALDLEPAQYRSRVTGYSLVVNGHQQVRRLTDLML